jgi:ABC-type glycerol-3-phosphate transport system substrate-binding protein
VLDTLLRVIARRRLAGLLAVAALFCSGLLLASCGSDDSESAGTTTETTTTTSTTTTETTITTQTTPPPPPGPTEIRIVVVNAAPKGGIVRETVKKNDRVVLIVRSDVTDHIHLHGYDIMRDVAPGKPAPLPFKATIPGVFEVELEDRGVQIADITVNP